MTKKLSVKSPKPARFPAYTIESEAGEVLASVPITASGGSHKLACAMSVAPELIAILAPFIEIFAKGGPDYTERMDKYWGYDNLNQARALLWKAAGDQ